MYKVLLVDDSSIDITLLKDILESSIPFEKQIAAFTNSEDAKAYYLMNKIDLIVTDLEMPDVDGFDLINCIKNGRGEEVIAVSGSPLKESSAKTILYTANVCGADHIVSKTNLYEDLQKVLTKICKHHTEQAIH